MSGEIASVEVLPPTQKIVYAPRPFAPLERHLAPAGLTIDQYVDGLPGMVDDLKDHLRVAVDGVEYSRDLWRITRPKPDMAVHVQLRLHNLKSAATFALIVAALAVNLIPGIGQFASAALSAAILTGGQLALNALFPAPRAAAGDADRGQGPGSASLAGNVLAKGRQLKRVMGTRRVAPDMIVWPLVEIIGEEEWIEAVFALAGPHSWADIRIGDTLASDMTDVFVETREGRRNEPALTLVTRYAFQDSPAIELSSHKLQEGDNNNLAVQSDPYSCVPRWHRVTSRGEADEIWIDLIFPEGIFDEGSTTAEMFVPVRFRMRQVGAAAWKNLPEVHFASKQARLIRKSVRLLWGDAPSPLPTSPTTDGPVRAYRETPDQTSPPVEDDGWLADSRFSGGVNYLDVQNVALYSDRAEFYLDDAGFPRGPYEIEVIKACVLATGSFTASTYVYDARTLNFFKFREGAAFEVPNNQRSRHGKVTLSRLASVFNANPAPLGGDALLGFRGRGRSFQLITSTASGLVPTYDAAAGEWSGLAASSNPADHYRDVPAGELTATPLPTDLLDDTALLAFRQFCASNNLAVSAICDGTSLSVALQVAAAAGHGEPRQSDLWGVIWERDRSAEDPEGPFTPRNSRRGPFIKEFAERARAMIVTFADAANDYRDNEVIVYDDGIDPEDPDILFEERRCDFYTDLALVEDWGLLQLRMSRLRDTLYEREVTFDGRMVIRGDLVECQDEVWDHDTGSAVIKEILTSDGLVTGLRLDAEVPLVDEGLFNDVPDVKTVANVRLLGKSSGVRIRLDDGTILHKAITGPTGPDDEIIFATPFTMPTANFGAGPEDSLTVGCLVAVGIMALESRRQIVASVTKKTVNSMRLKLFDEAPEIHAP